MYAIPAVHNRHNSLHIGVLINRTPFLLPEHIRTLNITVKTPPEHPSIRTLSLLSNIGIVQLLTRFSSNIGLSVPERSNPGFIAPKDTILIRYSPVQIILGLG